MTDYMGFDEFYLSPKMAIWENPQPGWGAIGDNDQHVDPQEEKSSQTSGHQASQLCGIDSSFSQSQQLEQPVFGTFATTTPHTGPDSCISHSGTVPLFPPQLSTWQSEVQPLSTAFGVSRARQDNSDPSKMFQNGAAHPARKRRRRSGPTAMEAIQKARFVPSRTEFLSLEISYNPSDDIQLSESSFTDDFRKVQSHRLIENRPSMTTPSSRAVSFEVPRKRRRPNGDSAIHMTSSSSSNIPPTSFTGSSGQGGEAQIRGTGSLKPGMGISPIPNLSFGYVNMTESSSIHDSMMRFAETENFGQFEADLFFNPWTNYLSDTETNPDSNPGQAFFLHQDPSIMRKNYPIGPVSIGEVSWNTHSEEYQPPISFLNSDNPKDVQITPQLDACCEVQTPPDTSNQPTSPLMSILKSTQSNPLHIARTSSELGLFRSESVRCAHDDLKPPYPAIRCQVLVF
jgi:hypothetical protein